MAYGDNIVANVSTYIQTIYELADATARDRNFITLLVRSFDDNSGTAIRTRSEYGTVTFNQITDSDDLSSQTHTPTTQESITPAFFGAQVFITDRRRRSDPHDVMMDAGTEIGAAAGKHVQTNVLANFSSLTGGTVGSLGGTLTWGNLYAAVARLRQQNAPEPYFGVLGNGQYYHLGTATVPGGNQTNAPVMQDAVTMRYFVGRFFNVDWYVTNDIAGNGGTAGYGAVFSRPAIAFDERLAFGIRPQRDESQGGGGIELNATMEYGEGVWRPRFGVQIRGTDVIP